MAALWKNLAPLTLHNISIKSKIKNKCQIWSQLQMLSCFLVWFFFFFWVIQVLPNQVMLSLEPSASSLHDWAYSEASGRREISQWQKGSKSTWATGLWEIYEGGRIWGDVQLCCALISWYSWNGRFFHINAHWNCFEQNLPYA